MQSRLLAPDTAWEEGRRICCDAVKRRLLPRKQLKVIAGASLYAACREGNSPVTVSDIAKAADGKALEIGRSYMVLLQRTGITAPPPNGTRFTLRVAAAMGISKEATAWAIEIEREAIRRGLEVRRPMTIAAASVYLACLSIGEKVTQAEVAETAGARKKSLRECIRAIRKLTTLPGTSP